MLANFSDLVKQFNLKIKGIIHVGAHYGQEYDAYVAAGVQNIAFIEPCKAAFSILSAKLAGKSGIKLFNCALGSSKGVATMNVEKANTGMSNSLLKPKKHLEQYPDIQFVDTEQVQVEVLDLLHLDIKQYNLLYMDVQGYELEVLKGAKYWLEKIEYVYTEINREELYEGCARVEQLDAYLHNFQRVYTNWDGGTWGDALYIKKHNLGANINTRTPEEYSNFRPHIRLDYPPDNTLIFEEWFKQNVRQEELSGKERAYLDIFWTSYYVNHEYGKNAIAIGALQQYIDKLDKTKKYFTVCQYDDGILNNISGLDIKVFAMSGPRIDYPLPLLCQPHNFIFPNKPRIYLANFIGRNTHPIRNSVLHNLSGRPRYYIKETIHNLWNYCDIIASSTFTLCPRGYGQTSFRIQEAIQFGSIPVYISDNFLIPHNVDFNSYGVLIDSKDANSIDAILSSISSEEIARKQAALKDVFNKYYTYSANKNIILSNI